MTASAGRWFILILLSAVTLVYFNSFGGVFLFDDERFVMQNPFYKTLWPLTTPMLNPLSIMLPLRGLTFAVNFRISGNEPWSYHLFNLLVHLGATLALYALVARLLRLGVFARKFEASAPWIAFFTALLWGVHPLQTQSVTYIYQRSESMMGFFTLASLYAFVRHLERPALKMALVSVCCAVLAALSKQVSYFIPLMALLIDWFCVSGALKKALKERLALYAGLFLVWPVIIYFNFIAADKWFQIGFDIGISPVRYAMTQLNVIAHYLLISVVPYRLVFDYGWPVAKSFTEVIPGALVVFPLLALGGWLLCRKSPLALLFAFFFLPLVPTSTFLPFSDIAFENRMYLSLAPVVLGAVLLFARRWDLRAPAAWLVPGLCAASLGVLAVSRNSDFSSQIAMWSDNAEKTPHNSRVLLNLGYAHYFTGEYTKTIEYLRRSLAIKRDSVDGLNILGSTYERLGRMSEAVALFEEAMKLEPDNHETNNNYAHVLFGLGRGKAAIERQKVAIRFNPYMPGYRINMAVYLRAVGDEEGARREMAEHERLRKYDIGPGARTSY